MARHVRLHSGPLLVGLAHFCGAVAGFQHLPSTLWGTPLAPCRAAAAPPSRCAMLSDQEAGSNFTPEEWEARRKLAQALGGAGLDRTLDPLATPLDPKQRSWEQEIEDLSNSELARKLAAAKASTKGAERKAIQKIVSSYFEEGAEEFLKSAERIISDGWAGWEESAAERSAATQQALLSDIDSKIKDLMANRKDVTAPLAASAEQHATTAQQVAADLEALLSSGAAAPSGAQDAAELAPPTYGQSVVPDSVLDQGPVTSLSKGTVLKEVVRTRADSGRVVVVGTDGPLGEAVLSRLLRTQQASGLSLEQVRKGVSGEDMRAMLQACGTLIVAPDKDAGANGGAGALGGLFGGADKSAVLLDTQVEALLAQCDGGKLKHVVCLSSIGANRQGQFPFSVQNVGGKLDAARAVEQAVVRRSKKTGFDYTILRVGRLCAEPSGKPGVDLEPGDALQGDTSRAIAEEAILQALTQPPARNATASIVSAAAAAPPTQALWMDLFLKLDGPELLRVPLADVMPKGAVDVTAAAIFMREWALLWTRPGTGLTTPVTVTASPRAPDGSERVEVLFKPTAAAFVSSKEEKAAAKARDKGDGAGGGGGGRHAKEGGVVFLVEASPYPRIRAVRAPLSEGAAVKEMSEELIMSRFQRDVKALSKP